MVLGRTDMVHLVFKRAAFLRELLSKDDGQLRIYRERERNMATITYNCQVKLFVKTTENKTVSKLVQTFRRRQLGECRDKKTRSLVGAISKAKSNTDMLFRKKWIKDYLQTCLHTL